MPWLWPVPIVLSGLFDHDPQSRKRRIIIYTLVATFIYSGTIVMMVPRHVTLGLMLLTTLVPFGPINLIIAFVVEMASQRLFRWLHIFDDTSLSARRRIYFVVAILGLAIAYPSTYQAIIFRNPRANGRETAAKDWAQGNAIWYMRRSDPVIFGASDYGCYSVENGLKTETMRPGVTANVYMEAYRAVVEKKLARSSPLDTTKNLFTKAELEALIKEGRFRRVSAFPLKQGTTEISPIGYKIDTGQRCSKGEPSKFVYCAIVPEKRNALVVINDDSIWIFSESGQLLQSVDYESYQQMGITGNDFKGS